MQHLNDDLIAQQKREMVVEALQNHGVDAPVAPTSTVPPASRRRAKFALTRTKKTRIIGFHTSKSDQIVSALECAVIDPKIREALPALTEALLPGVARARPIELQVTLTQTGLDVSVTGGKALDLSLRQTLGMAAEHADIARLTWDFDAIAMRRVPQLRFGRSVVAPPPGAFLQAVPQMEQIALDLITAELPEGARLIELFCGCGTFTLPLAQAHRIDAFDADQPLIDALRDAANGTQDLKPLHTEVRDLFRRPLLPSELKTCDAVLIDPPRAGAKAQHEALAASEVPLIIEISCNPGTFARDAAILCAGGYTLTQVTPIDQFRWSNHVELVGVFRRD